MKKFVLLIISCLFISLLASCQSKEESTLSKFQAISEQLEQKGSDMTDEEWDKLQVKYTALLEDVKTCNFTDEQLEELGKLEAKITTLIIKKKGSDFGKSIKDVFKKGKSIVEGVKEGLKADSED